MGQKQVIGRAAAGPPLGMHQQVAFLPIQVDELVQVLEQCPRAMAILDRQSRFIRVNAGFESLFDYQESELISRTPEGTIFPGSWGLEQPQRQIDRVETVGVRKGGEWLDVSIVTFPVWLDTDQPGSCVFYENISEPKKAELANHRVFQTYYDSLTGLPTRLHLQDRLARCLDRFRGPAEFSLSLLVVDLENFQAINDRLGYETGDRLLRRFAERLRAALRPGDFVARLGDSEFVVLVEQLSDARAVEVAQRIHRISRSAPELEGGQLVHVTTRIGIARSWKGWGEPEDLLRAGKLAVKEAKRRRSPSVVHFESQMEVVACRRAALADELSRALAEEELFLVYQPIFELDTLSVCGVEALLRWNHPTRTKVSPRDLVASAGEAGFGEDLGWWVFRTACQELGDLVLEHQNLTLSVNVSPDHLSCPDFAATLRSLLDQHRLAPRNICLEITEDVILDSTDASVAALLEVAELGFQLHLDDFGTGYSSLRYLLRCPIHAIKIADSFIVDMLDTEGQQDLVAAIVVFARRLGLRVIAEGIETAEVEQSLRGMECNVGQGFGLARPMKAADLQEWLVANGELH